MHSALDTSLVYYFYTLAISIEPEEESQDEDTNFNETNKKMTRNDFRPTHTTNTISIAIHP